MATNLVVAYDVNTLQPEGRRRLRKVAKICEGFGQRVQLSVFECTLSDTQLVQFRQKLLKVIDETEDSLRLYTLSGNRQNSIECHGRDQYIDFKGPLIV